MCQTPAKELKRVAKVSEEMAIIDGIKRHITALKAEETLRWWGCVTVIRSG
jgi:hypothetical protein